MCECVHTLVYACEHVCVCVRTCVHTGVCVYPQYSPLKMHTNTMMTVMIMQTMITAPTIPTAIGITEDGDEDGAVGFIQEKMQEEIHRYISILV